MKKFLAYVLQTELILESKDYNYIELLPFILQLQFVYSQECYKGIWYITMLNLSMCNSHMC